MNNRPIAHEYPIITIQSLNANARFIGGDHISAAQVLDDICFSGCKRLMQAFQHVLEGKCSIPGFDFLPQ